MFSSQNVCPVHRLVIIVFVIIVTVLMRLGNLRSQDSRDSQGGAVNPTFLYFLVVLVSCLLEYGATRFLVRLPRSMQNGIFAACVAACIFVLVIFRHQIAATNSVVLTVALVAGILLGRQVASASALSIMLVVAAISDVISTYSGFTKLLINRAGHSHGVTAIQFLSVSIPLNGRAIPVIGVGDLMFFTVCVSVAIRLRWPQTFALLVPLAGLLTALSFGLFIGFSPALPFLAAAILLYTLSQGLIRPCES